MKAKALYLTPEQVGLIEPFANLGFVVLGRVKRETLDDDCKNIETAGRWVFEFGSVPEASLPALRGAIAKANATKKRKAK
jgi:hypothetical protein